MGVRLAFALLLAACGVKVSGGAAAHTDQPDAGARTDAATQIDAAMLTIDAAPCTGATDAEGNCYELFAGPLEWTAAETACEGIGGHLAIIRSAEQNGVIATLLSATTIAFIGATDQVTEGTFLWVDNTDLTFTDFPTGEPNNGGGKFEEDCLSIRGDNADQWDDRPCGAEPGAGGTGQDATMYPYVCER